MATAACGGGAESGEANAGRHPGGGGMQGGMPRNGGSEQEAVSAVPVEVASVVRRTISSYIETNGTLEAENEVDIVARVAAPVVELLTEEGMTVDKGQLLARLDAVEYRTRIEISRVSLNETKLAFDRAVELQQDELISTEEFERAKAAYESARAQFEGDEIELSYTEIRAPFGGRIVRRYVDNAENVAANEALFRISDFTPLLCPIQVPERDLSRLRSDQRAYLTVESWPDERFGAKVLRISPIVDAATGTIKVTLEVDGRDKLRPGMFARVFVETDSRADALVIPKAALSLESIGDTVYVAEDDLASRREVVLGFREGDYVEVVSGIAPADEVVVVGQDGLSDGTPIRVLRRDGEPTGPTPAPETETASREEPRPPGAGQLRPGGPGQRGGRPDFSTMTPEQLERAKEFMRARGMTDEQIEERVKRAGGSSSSEARTP
jgi:RND family efflux transporter MFP subunit